MSGLVTSLLRGSQVYSRMKNEANKIFGFAQIDIIILYNTQHEFLQQMFFHCNKCHEKIILLLSSIKKTFDNILLANQITLQ